MPQCTGWQFIDAVQGDWSSDHIDNIKICVLSSSVHPTDLQKAEESFLVKLYSEKPTDTTAMASIIGALF
jgi:hypothetical protein